MIPPRRHGWRFEIQRLIASGVPGTRKADGGGTWWRVGGFTSTKRQDFRLATEGVMDILARLIGIDSSQPNELDTTRARQGVTGHNVRYVLGLALLGVIVGFVIAYWLVRASFG
jgi:hypothetical protein